MTPAAAAAVRDQSRRPASPPRGEIMRHVEAEPRQIARRIEAAAAGLFEPGAGIAGARRRRRRKCGRGDRYARRQNEETVCLSCVFRCHCESIRRAGSVEEHCMTAFLSASEDR